MPSVAELSSARVGCTGGQEGRSGGVGAGSSTLELWRLDGLRPGVRRKELLSVSQLLHDAATLLAGVPGADACRCG